MGDDKSIPKADKGPQQSPDLSKPGTPSVAAVPSNKTIADVSSPATSVGRPAPIPLSDLPIPRPFERTGPNATRVESAQPARAATPSATVMEAAPSKPGPPRPPVMPTIQEPNIARPSAVPHQATRVESIEEIRKIVSDARAAIAPATPSASTPVPASTALPFRPARRPPIGFLTICDDGDSAGEVVRVRGDRLVIGRDHGDLRIPHDPQMSSTHAEIVREASATAWQWALVDLDSANGVFIRIPSTQLKNGDEVSIGSTRLRFDDAALNLPGAIQETGAAMPAKTVGWHAFAPTDLKASIVVFRADGSETRHFLDASEVWIGRDAACPIALLDDPLAELRHARIVRDAKGNWKLVNAGSRNGLWLRTRRHVIETECEFQLGEQRFVFRAGKVM
jgi:pSer/pThr/pTyr-binding forkhead associated (FHA) protein